MEGTTLRPGTRPTTGIRLRTGGLIVSALSLAMMAAALRAIAGATSTATNRAATAGPKAMAGGLPWSATTRPGPGAHGRAMQRRIAGHRTGGA